MQTRKKTEEDYRYLAYRVGAHVAWWSALAWTTVLTWKRLDGPTVPPSKFEVISGPIIVLLIGVAISLGTALARMRLAKTLAQVLQAGITIGSMKESDKE